MINIPYRAATQLGLWNRRRFMKRLGALPPVHSPGEVPATVYSLSGFGDWPEQAACIRSFLRFVGLPKRFVVISDGSHSAESASGLERLSPCVSVVAYDSFVKPNLSARIRQYAAQHFLGKKLAMFLSLPIDGPTVYTDSDILYFHGASKLAGLLQALPPTPLYLQDCWPSLDARLLADESEKDLPVNGGFLIFSRALDWAPALDRLEHMEGDCVFFTEQTMVHLTVKACGGKPLPTDEFILRAEDQFAFSDYYAGNGIALRHYISSIRTKFWRQERLFS